MLRCDKQWSIYNKLGIVVCILVVYNLRSCWNNIWVKRRKVRKGWGCISFTSTYTFQTRLLLFYLFLLHCFDCWIEIKYFIHSFIHSLIHIFQICNDETLLRPSNLLVSPEQTVRKCVQYEYKHFKWSTRKILEDFFSLQLIKAYKEYPC